MTTLLVCIIEYDGTTTYDNEPIMISNNNFIREWYLSLLYIVNRLKV